MHLPLKCVGKWGFPGVSVVKNLPASARDAGDLSSIPGSGRSPGKENGNLLQYFCLKSPTDRGAWWATVHGVAKSGTRLTEHACTSMLLELPWKIAIGWLL